ncbi:MAG TPA: hypothetical protein VFU15_11430, partial [Bacteroidia bacterium]|nr:hypothetical protein [Bacteroidia bacterium]
MKTMIKNASVAICMLCATGAFAQTLQDAIRYTESEQYEKAKAVLKKLVAADPNNGDNYFYFGDLMLKEESPDSAFILFKKGTDINPTNPLTHVGLGRYYMYQGKNTEGQQELTNAKSLVQATAGKKDMGMTPKRQALIDLEIAETYIWAPTPDIQQALDLIATAEKLDKDNPEVYLQRGDALYKKDPVNGSPANAAYIIAAQKDPKSCKAYLRMGDIIANGQNMV